LHSGLKAGIYEFCGLRTSNTAIYRVDPFQATVIDRTDRTATTVPAGLAPGAADDKNGGN
jgi:hypothetical protein